MCLVYYYDYIKSNFLLAVVQIPSQNWKQSEEREIERVKGEGENEEKDAGYIKLENITIISLKERERERISTRNLNTKHYIVKYRFPGGLWTVHNCLL